MISFARLHLPYPVKAVQQEVEALPAQWHAHFNTAHYTGEWTAIALRSPGGSNTLLPEAAD
ncbi:hypothetical protein [Deminuibacter soli]|uniref:hypothetical protein n=1 Tax=Deminuibacter soli TaxID=2291815 RepID=UPI001314209C|nr:hypothetical protein [Deminuibacter soli]